MPGVVPCSTSPPVIIKVAASGYLPHLLFGAIGPLELHESGCTLEFQLHLYWLALEMLVGGRPGARNLAQLQFGKCLVALPARGDHDFPLPILTGWLMHLLEFCNVFRGWFFSRRPPHIWFFLEGGFATNIFRFGSHASIYFCFTEFSVLELSKMIVDFIVIYVPRPILIIYLCICLIMNMKYVDRLVFPIILYYDPVNCQR